MTSSEFAPRAALAALVLLAVATAVMLVTGPSLVSIGLVALVLLPVVIYLALRWPLASAFGLYVLLVPFDNLLNTGSFGTMTKLLGMVAGAALLLYVVRQRRERLLHPRLWHLPAPLRRCPRCWGARQASGVAGVDEAT